MFSVQPEEASPGVKQPGAGLPFQHHCLLSCCTHASHVCVGGGGLHMISQSLSDITVVEITHWSFWHL